MTPSKETVALNNALPISNKVLDDVRTKDSAAALFATPKENTSKPDHEVVMEVAEVAKANFDDVRRENVTEDVVRTGDIATQNVEELPRGGGGVVIQHVKELPRGGEKDVMLEIPDGKANIFVASRHGEPVKLVVTSVADDHSFPQTKLSQIELAFCAQLAAVFVGNALNKSSSCSHAASPSPTHSDSPEWITVIVIVLNLIGFVFILIAISLENQKSPPTKKRTVSSLVAKFGLAAVASAIVVSMVAPLPLHINGNLAVTAVASLSSLIAIALA